MSRNRTSLVAAGVLAIIGLAYWAGTRRSEPDASARADNRATATATGSASAAAAPGSAMPSVSASAPTRGPLDMSGLDGLGARLAAEKAKAGKSDPNAAGVFAAIQNKLKIPLGEPLQPVASVVGAEYCQRMTTKHDVYVVVCEFSSEDAAKTGQKKGTNDVVKRREVLQRRAATCAVHRAGETKEAEDEAKRIRDLFLSM